MYTVIRQYRADPSAVDQVVERAREGFVPLLKQAPGFVGYAIVDAGGGQAFSISTFQDKAGADESVRLAASWVRDNVAALHPNPPQIVAGETRVRKVNPQTRPTHGVIRRYKTDPSRVDEIIRRAEEGFVPLVSGAKGFGRYSLVDAGNGDIISLTAFESEAATTESTRRAADWVKENLAELLPTPPQVTAGTIRIIV